MSALLHRLGRLAARHPWRMIGAWIVIAVVIVGASGAVGRDLDDTFAVPGLDSQDALDLLEGEAGLPAPEMEAVEPAEREQVASEHDEETQEAMQ